MMSRSRQNIRALVPVKRLGGAKSRLGTLLDPVERAQLMTAMLCDVLDVLTRVRMLDGVSIVTGDASVAAIGREMGAEVIDDPDEAGVNEAVNHGLRRLVAEGCPSALIVPADTPFVSVGEIERAVAALARRPVVLVPASRDGGTNLLGLAPIGAIAPAFGPDSFRKHLAACSAAGLQADVLALEGLGHDIDMPADLLPGVGGGPARRTRALLSEFAHVPASLSSGCFEEAFQP